MKLNDLLTVLYPVINIIIGLAVAWIGGVIVKLAPGVFKLIESKIGIANYNKIKTVGIDIFNKIEEDGRLGKLTDTKINTFETFIKGEFPSITDYEINLVRQSIAGEFNKDKPLVEKTIEDTESPIQTIVTQPIKKYVTEDGIELVPKEIPITDPTATV